MLDTCSRVFTSITQPLSEVAKQLPHKHQPIIFGAVCGLLGIDLHSAMTGFLFSAIRTIVASAVRLDRVGPIEVWLLFCGLAHVYLINSWKTAPL